jgi:hypothetical protein
MALTQCRECSAEVSDSAKACPKCGVGNPVKKKSTIAVKLFWGFVSILIISAVYKNESSIENSVKPLVPASTSESALLANIIVKDFSWQAGGLKSVMIISKMTIRNDNKESVKDFELECIQNGPSGTVISRNKKTIFQVIPGYKAITLREISMGFMNSQSASASCNIIGVKNG